MAVTDVGGTVAILRSVGGLVFDATLRESHTSEIEVTSNPIETGSEVSDHMYVKPDKLTISAGVSDTPLVANPNDQFSGGRRSQTAFQMLKQLQASGEPFDIQTGLTLYKNMLCKSVRAEQDKDTDQALLFEADFVGVNIVSTQTITYPARSSRSGQAPKQKGDQQGKQVTDDNKRQSLLYSLIHLLRGQPNDNPAPTK
jgi:hypothetical protein